MKNTKSSEMLKYFHFSATQETSISFQLSSSICVFSRRRPLSLSHSIFLPFTRTHALICTFTNTLEHTHAHLNTHTHILTHATQSQPILLPHQSITHSHQHDPFGLGLYWARSIYSLWDTPAHTHTHIDTLSNTLRPSKLHTHLSCQTLGSCQISRIKDKARILLASSEALWSLSRTLSKRFSNPTIQDTATAHK